MLKRFAFSFLSLFLIVSTAAAATDCRPNALQYIKRLDPHGYKIYLQDKVSFMDKGYWDCSDIVTNADTAVHEQTHILSANSNSYVMIDGTMIARAPDGPLFFPPSELASQIDPTMDMSIYIVDKHDPGQPSSVSDFGYLLDELNAYSNGLYTTTRMISVKTTIDDSRDGAIAMMHFLDLYATRAKKLHAHTWAALNASPTRETIQKLWAQAHAVEVDACRAKVTGMQDGWYLDRLCAANGHDALSEILGYRIECPKNCVGLTQSQQQQNDSSVNETPDNN